MKVFLDIGAHNGETLRTVVAPEWGFDRIVCFEPAPQCWRKLHALADRRVEVCEFGLYSRDTKLTLHNPGKIGASIASDKDPGGDYVECTLRDSATWFSENLAENDEVFAKINVEGAEIDIIDRLSESNLLSRIDHLLVHFDASKVPSLRGKELSAQKALYDSGVEFHSADEILFGGVYRGTRNWLRWCHATPRFRDLRYKRVARWEYKGRRALFPLKSYLGRSLTRIGE